LQDRLLRGGRLAAQAPDLDHPPAARRGAQGGAGQLQLGQFQPLADGGGGGVGLSPPLAFAGGLQLQLGDAQPLVPAPGGLVHGVAGGGQLGLGLGDEQLRVLLLLHRDDGRAGALQVLHPLLAGAGGGQGLLQHRRLQLQGADVQRGDLLQLLLSGLGQRDLLFGGGDRLLLGQRGVAQLLAEQFGLGLPLAPAGEEDQFLAPVEGGVGRDGERRRVGADEDFVDLVTGRAADGEQAAGGAEPAQGDDRGVGRLGRRLVGLGRPGAARHRQVPERGGAGGVGGAGGQEHRQQRRRPAGGGRRVHGGPRGCGGQFRQPNRRGRPGQPHLPPALPARLLLPPQVAHG
jgi:hypothetical protein